MGKIFDSIFPRYVPPIVVTSPKPAHRFAIGDDYATWNSLVNGTPTGKVTRAQAMSVPAIKRARDVFCGSLGSLPLHTYNANGEKVARRLMEQPEAYLGHTRNVTMAMTLDDLFFQSSCLWTVKNRDSTSFPSVVERIPHSRWNQDPDTGVIMVDGVKEDNRDCIVFVSPNDALLTTGANTIRALIRLEQSATMYLSKPEMSEYFTPTEGQEPDDEEIQDFLDDWATSRRNGTTGYIPGSVERHEVKRLTAEELQLASCREFSIAEVSRLTGLSPNWLALNITSRTYANMVDERRDFVDFPAAPFIAAVEQRLSINDVTPNGQYVKFNLDGFLRANTTERYASYTAALAGGWLTVDEIRALENRPPIVITESDTDG